MSIETLNHQQAVTALQELTAQGTITEYDVSEAIATRAAKYQARLDILKYGILTSQSVLVELPAKRSVGRPKGSKAGRPKKDLSTLGDTFSSGIGKPSKPKLAAKPKAKKVTPEVLASRQLQGKYIAAIRSVPKSRKAEFQKIQKTKSREAAIRAINAYKKGKGAPKAAKATKVPAKAKNAPKVKAKAVAKKSAAKVTKKVAPKKATPKAAPKESTFARAMEATTKPKAKRVRKPKAAPIVATEIFKNLPGAFAPLVVASDEGNAVSEDDNRTTVSPAENDAQALTVAEAEESAPGAEETAQAI